MLKRKWHGIPVALVSAMLALVLIASSVFAAYTFTGMEVDVAVDEPLQVQYNLMWFVHDNESPDGRWDQSDWQDAEGLGVVINAYFSAGDEMTLYLRMNNRANSTLTVNTLVGGDTDMFTYSGFPQSEIIPVSNGWDFGSNTVGDAEAADWDNLPEIRAPGTEGVSIKVNGDVIPDNYTLTFEFTRE